MQTFGANCYASPSNRTPTGKAILEKDPNNTGSLGIAISEAVEKSQKSLEDQIQDEQTAFESKTLGTAADIVAGDGEFKTIASTPTFENVNDANLGMYQGDTINVQGVTMVWTPFQPPLTGGMYQPQET